MNIIYLTYNEIDKQKWDDCIDRSANGLIYGRSFYLDAFCKNWDALVMNDYEAVMPLTSKKKWGINYLYQPPFVQQLGIFYTTTLSPVQLQAFIDKAIQRFKFAEITLNFLNWQDEKQVSFELTKRTNFILDLNKSYNELYKNYDASFTKSLRRIKKFGLSYYISHDYQKNIMLYKTLYGKRLTSFEEKSYEAIKRICKTLAGGNNLVIREVYDSEKQFLASVILLKDSKRLYNIISCVTNEGKKKEANYFLYDRIVHEFSATARLFDLEGSDVKGIAAFYKKLNPVDQPYPFIRYNHLPALLKIFKA